MFEVIQAQPHDAILQLMALYRQDPNPHKVDLGVGVYKDELGNTPIMQAVDRAERILLEQELTKSYIGPAGSPLYNQLISELILGQSLYQQLSDRLAIAQTPGGCGALRMAAEFLKSCSPDTTVWVSDPTWANHIPLLGGAGLKIQTYAYYDHASGGIQFDKMMSALENAKTGDIVLLHGCCHNPSGADLNLEQWKAVTELVQRKGLLPFVDIAYQGLGDGLDQDAAGVRFMAEQVPELIIAASCSKNFGLYRERTGVLLILSANAQQAPNTASQLFGTIRSHYSMPPNHGAAIVEVILGNGDLRNLWQQELGQMRKRISDLRVQFNHTLSQQGVAQDFSFIERQKGMFSFLGISAAQVHRLRDEYSIYMVDSSRVNVAGLSGQNLDYVCKAVANVLKTS
ncbi:aromatic amino acid transaminase [Nitrincola alkalilacustris]|uniref:amino acid aminotransferase n=1 Tax=Nitrincola alkalilacustris TaxID=1571224 RepID=UPI00124D9709|nr:amino acid aminotransferase [Nitrincola alkalilacustris]